MRRGAFTKTSEFQIASMGWFGIFVAGRTTKTRNQQKNYN